MRPLGTNRPVRDVPMFDMTDGAFVVFKLGGEYSGGIVKSFGKAEVTVEMMEQNVSGLS